MEVRPATLTDVDVAVRCLVGAFAGDPITGYFFQSVPDRRDAAAALFFSILLRVRLILRMPVLLAVDDDKVVGVAMGYDASRLAWPPELSQEWAALEASVAGMPERSRLYDQVSSCGVPGSPHYYLGVIGIDPNRQGEGIGRALLSAFCQLSSDDPKSSGVYLETATPANLGFYEKSGFKQTHRAAMGNATLWCLFRPSGA